MLYTKNPYDGVNKLEAALTLPSDHTVPPPNPTSTPNPTDITK